MKKHSRRCASCGYYLVIASDGNVECINDYCPSTAGARASNELASHVATGAFFFVVWGIRASFVALFVWAFLKLWALP